MMGTIFHFEIPMTKTVPKILSIAIAALLAAADHFDILIFVGLTENRRISSANKIWQ